VGREEWVMRLRQLICFGLNWIGMNSRQWMLRMEPTSYALIVRSAGGFMRARTLEWVKWPTRRVPEDRAVRDMGQAGGTADLRLREHQKRGEKKGCVLGLRMLNMGSRLQRGSLGGGGGRT
jgi:hypothetical protein